MAKQLRQIEVSVVKSVTITYETKITVTAATDAEAKREAERQSVHVPDRKWNIADTERGEPVGEVL